MLTSSTASLKDNKLSGAFRISSITLGSVTTTSHRSIPGTLNIGHWKSLLKIAHIRSEEYRNSPCSCRQWRHSSEPTRTWRLRGRRKAARQTQSTGCAWAEGFPVGGWFKVRINSISNTDWLLICFNRSEYFAPFDFALCNSLKPANRQWSRKLREVGGWRWLVAAHPLDLWGETSLFSSVGVGGFWRKESLNMQQDNIPGNIAEWSWQLEPSGLCESNFFHT